MIQIITSFYLELAGIMVEKIELEWKQIRTLLLYEFRLNHKAAAATRNICDAMGEGTIFYHTAVDWFNKFKNDDFDIDEHTAGRRAGELDELRLL